MQELVPVFKQESTSPSGCRRRRNEMLDAPAAWPWLWNRSRCHWEAPQDVDWHRYSEPPGQRRHRFIPFERWRGAV
jgi:hypothetical protein